MVGGEEIETSILVDRLTKNKNRVAQKKRSEQKSVIAFREEEVKLRRV